MNKKYLLLVLVVIGGILFVVGGNMMNKKIQFNTETAPIYNHFPDLPETSEIQWYSKSSEGIGLTTTKICIFVFYDHDIRDELQEMNFRIESENIEFSAMPNNVNSNQKWRCADNAYFAFQSSIKDTQKMNTTVYLNDEGNILYIEAIGD